MDCEGWKVGERRHIAGLEWSEMDSWRKWCPVQRERPEVENTVGDGRKSWKLLWLESRALWERLTVRLKR